MDLQESGRGVGFMFCSQEAEHTYSVTKELIIKMVLRNLKSEPYSKRECNGTSFILSCRE